MSTAKAGCVAILRAAFWPKTALIAAIFQVDIAFMSISQMKNAMPPTQIIRAVLKFKNITAGRSFEKSPRLFYLTTY